MWSQRWLRLTTFQEINFIVQQIWILTWCVKRQNIAGLCQQNFYFCSADSFSWSCFAFCWIGAKIQIFSKYLYGKVIPWNGTSGDLPLTGHMVYNLAYTFKSYRWQPRISINLYKKFNPKSSLSWNFIKWDCVLSISW